MADKKHVELAPDILESLPHTNIDDLVLTIKYYVDEDYGHIRIEDHAVCAKCKHKPCLNFCPAHVFTKDRQGKILVGYQACVECGSCRIGCPYQNIDWNLPRGGYGVAYKFG